MPTPETVQPQNAAELSPEQLAETLAAQQTGGEPPQLQREYVVQTSTGAVFRGKTQQELIDQLQKSVESGSEERKRQKDELEALKARLEQLAPPAQQPPQNQQPQFNPQRYYEGWAQNPVDAEVQLIDYALQSRYGVSLDEFANQVQQSHRFVRQVEPEVTARAWMSSSDFPTSNPEEMQKAANAFEGVWNEFFPNDLQMTPQKLEMVHAVALKRGLYQPEGAQQAPAENPAQPTPTGLPTLNTGATGDSGTGAQQEVTRMTPEQIRQLIDQLR